ncbi:GNAT family N-acetyltransferase [Burkholderia sp. BCC1644]|uniref:GNAT family N-acetyltransferase n=1 Tax=Burkholderia sp. BCC1644 TaxID=2676293 RepID=UPI001FC8DEAD|nr:GNAT family N-acetyltransferase [Burkholderia sp. BCC1644]
MHADERVRYGKRPAAHGMRIRVFADPNASKVMRIFDGLPLAPRRANAPGGNVSAFEIRSANESDTQRIFEVHLDSVTRLCAADYSREQIASWLDGRTPAMYLDAIGRHALWVADDGDVLGFAETAGEELTKLFVRGDRARSGAGQALLETAVSGIARDGCARVYLEATTNAVPFYERHGFAVIGTGHFSHGNSPIQLEIVKMEKWLSRE